MGTAHTTMSIVTYTENPQDYCNAAFRNYYPHFIFSSFASHSHERAAGGGGPNLQPIPMTFNNPFPPACIYSTYYLRPVRLQCVTFDTHGSRRLLIKENLLGRLKASHELERKCGHIV